MTVLIDSYKGNGNYCSLELTKENTYVVEVCMMYDMQLCGYPFRKMIYSVSEEKRARATFRRYIKKYCMEERN